MGVLHEKSETGSGKAVTQRRPARSAKLTFDDSPLLAAFRQLASAKSLDEVFQLICATARALTGADGAALILGEKSQCLYVAEDAVEPLWKGQRFASGRCLSGWAMEHRTPALIPDIHQDARVPLDLYSKTFVRSLAIIPVCVDVPIGAIGVYWAAIHSLDDALLAQLQTFAGFAAVTLESMRRRNFLEERLHQSETELQTTQRKLAAEIHLRSQLESRISLLDQTDALTGLNNQLGFLSRATQLFKLIKRVPVQAWLIYIDLDDFRHIHNAQGHESCDRIIQDAARVLRESFRESDVLGRVRDDEFVAFVVAASDPLAEIESRLIRNIDHLNHRQADKPPLAVSIGAVRCNPRGRTTLEDLIHQADAAMYRSKRKKRLKVVESPAR